MKMLAMIPVLAAGLVAQTANAVVLPQLDPTALDTGFISTSGDTPASITFNNLTGSAVDVYWINYSGDRVLYQTLAAYSSYIQGTYITHPWVVALAGSGDTLAQGTGTLLAGFLAETPDAAGLGPDIANIGSVPEPAAWSLMIGGFAMTGVAVRRRRTLNAAATT